MVDQIWLEFFFSLPLLYGSLHFHKYKSQAYRVVSLTVLRLKSIYMHTLAVDYDS